MDLQAETPPPVGTELEMQRPSGGGFFERAVVVGRAADAVHGVVLEVEFEDATRVQRVWPSPAIRLLG